MEDIIMNGTIHFLVELYEDEIDFSKCKNFTEMEQLIKEYEESNNFDEVFLDMSWHPDFQED